MSETKTSKHHFKAEIKQLLDILVHSLYTSREIFLREIISNASDALDKLRFQTTKGAEIANSDLPLEIRISFDEKNNTLTIKDTGIGMTEMDLVENIGTIAKSGSADFLKQIADSKADANNIIGKFGVGFYSVFMVASKVVIKTKSYLKDEPACMWVSDGLGDYEITRLDEERKRGTEIEIHLKEDAKEFAEQYRIQSVIKKYSNFITFPIFVNEEQINTVSAIWREQKSKVTPEKYNEFYKFLTYDMEEPADTIHISVDAPYQYYSLLFIPKKNNDFFHMNREDYGLDLYVRRVLIQHKNKELIPEYLGFVKGVVDSEDLPLNISRETLQENVVFNKISKNLVSQIYSYLTKKAKDEPEKFYEFWKEHGNLFKLGYSDYANAEKFQQLLRFNSSTSEKQTDMISLEDYVGRLKEGQKEIYYAMGPTREALKSSPHLEIFNTKGIEVLFLYEPLDEFVINSIRKYKDYEFKAVETIDPNDLTKFNDENEVKQQNEPLNSDDNKVLDELIVKMKEVLGNRVEDVKVSTRLVGSPSCLTGKDDVMSATMKRIMKMQNQDLGMDKKVFEINPNHNLVRNLIAIFKTDSKDNYIAEVTEQLYDSALLLEGSLEDPHKLISRLNKFLEQSSSWYAEQKGNNN